MDPGQFAVSVSKESFKFNAAHFIAQKGRAREKLHGHNYTAGVLRPALLVAICPPPSVHT